MYVGFDLHLDWCIVLRRVLGFHQGLRPVVAPTFRSAFLKCNVPT